MAPTTFRRIQISGPPQRNQTPETLSSPQESESAIFDSPILAPPRSQIPRPSNESRKGSFSDTEGQPVARLQVRSARSSSRSGDDARPSGLPRLATNLPTSQRPLGVVTSPRPVTPQNPQTQQPTYNATNVSQQGGRTRNVLRRMANFTKENTNDSAQFRTIKPQTSSSTVHSGPSDSSKGRSRDAKDETATDVPFTDSSSATSRLPRVRTPRSSEDSRPIAKEFASLRTVNQPTNTNNLPPPTPMFSSTGSPSTRYSESPSIWDSRDSTPTSLSSHSPGIVHSAKVPQRIRQPSPSYIRPPVVVPRSFTSPVVRTTKQEPAIASTSTITDSGVSIEDKTNKSLPESPTRRKFLPRSDNPDSAGDETATTAAEVRVFAPATQPQVNPTSRSATAPPRPSRQGTDSLGLMASPVIHSNLTSLKTTGRAGRETSEKSTKQQVMPVPSAATSVESIQSVSSKLSRSGPTSSQIPKKSKQVLTKSPKQPSEPSSTRRLGLFSKKSKSDLGGSRSTQAAGVSTRKGPAAGTGHEGYGKYSHRGRKPSIGSSTAGTRARSASTTGRSIGSSRGSQAESELDDFLLERLEPVVISGGGSELVRTQSGQSASAVSVTSAGTSSSIAAGIPIGGGYSTDSLTSSSSLAAPLHRQRSPVFPPPSPAKISPKPGQSSVQTQKSKEQDAGISALPQIESAPPGRDAKKSEKHGHFRWNFFQRKHNNSDKESRPPASSSRAEGQLHAAIAPVSTHRTVPHYALIEPDSDSLDEILHRIEDSPPSEDEVAVSQGPSANQEAAQRHGPSVLLPSPPPLWAEFAENAAAAPRPASPKVYFHKEAGQNKDNDKDNNPPTGRTRPSRLNPVGRIPRVVPRQGTDSRPAAQLGGRSDDSAAPRGIINNQASVQTVEKQSFSPESQPVRPKPSLAINEGIQFASGAYASNEFLHFSPNQESYNSSSSSEGNSILAAVTAMGPQPHQWSALEDDFWAEYDDLVESALRSENPAPPTKPAAPEPERTKPFELATKASMTLQAELNTTRDEGAEASRSPEIQTVALPPSSARSSQSSVRLRRSAIAPALHTSISPQVSSGDLIAGYREQIMASDNTAPEEPAPPAAASEQENAPAEDIDAARRRKLLEQAERDRDGAMAQINLRSASLMTSRWLSFGRVLFSPAHNRIKAAVDTERILVIDGLGNDDWSYYCALTYPSATVYSLTVTPTPTSPTAPAHPNAWSPPENHHLIYYADPETPFPFPKNFFSVCIMRFPAACSERGQQNMISECKRVLRPGGYLEMSILDLDLVNVGTRTRKAVRQLKERIFLADPAINLKPASDHIQRLLGTCGFDNLNRCMVGLPVAGMITGSTSSSDSSSADHSNNPPHAQPSASTTTMTPSPHSRASSDDDAKHSLGELLSDPSPTASNDESIAKMVTRVGRWWYTRCYEVPVLENLDDSIWADHRLLRECQKRGTSFRLLIAYAQKPSEKRRTMSV
ncbi:hypothetical protein VTN49DRAFT_4461 [Thermomyces lanuginosus]|uniref:uncharacterized protein n=1 Tax=Thermomyces lanuginosus TaxID=5541 RepID=UPI003743A34E